MTKGGRKARRGDLPIPDTATLSKAAKEPKARPSRKEGTPGNPARRMPVDSPLAWVGGKRILRKQIIPLIPKDHTCYVEVFAGGSWVLFGKERSKVEVLNDKDGELINFYNVVTKHPEEFSRQAKQLLISRRLFDIMKSQTVDLLTDIERAVRFYYLLRLAFGARMKRPTFGTMTDGRVKWRAEVFARQLKEVSRRLDGVVLECLDYEDLIQRYDRPWTLFYCDPPFLGAENVYEAPFGMEDHKRLARLLRKLKGRFILSYNDHPEIWKLYEGFNFRQVEGHYSISREINGRRSFGEIIVINF